MHDRGHVVVDDLADLSAGNGALIRQGVRYPDRVDVPFAELVFEHAVDALHALALQLVVHDHHVAVEAFHVFPQLEDVLVSADGHGAHGRLFVEPGKVFEGVLIGIGAQQL